MKKETYAEKAVRKYRPIKQRRGCGCLSFLLSLWLIIALIVGGIVAYNAYKRHEARKELMEEQRSEIFVMDSQQEEAKFIESLKDKWRMKMPIVNHMIVSSIMMLTMIALMVPKWKEKDPVGAKKYRNILFVIIALVAVSLLCGIADRIMAVDAMGVPTFGEFIYTIGLGVASGVMAALVGSFFAFHVLRKEKK